MHRFRCRLSEQQSAIRIGGGTGIYSPTVAMLFDVLGAVDMG